MVIMGILAVVLYVPVLLWLKDLAPKLRLMVLDSETTGEAFESGDLPHEAPGTAMSAFRPIVGSMGGVADGDRRGGFHHGRDHGADVWPNDVRASVRVRPRNG